MKGNAGPVRRAIVVRTFITVSLIPNKDTFDICEIVKLSLILTVQSIFVQVQYLGHIHVRMQKSLTVTVIGFNRKYNNLHDTYVSRHVESAKAMGLHECHGRPGSCTVGSFSVYMY